MFWQTWPLLKSQSTRTILLGQSISTIVIRGESALGVNSAVHTDVNALSVIDAMANYTNLLGFFAGNEVAFAPNSTDAAPFVKAAVRYVLPINTYLLVSV